jgi:uncharacterized protein (TIGR02453 family)
MFPTDTLKFLAELGKNNNKAWFDANKTRFQDNVQAPALEFVRAMAPRLKKISPQLIADDRKSGGSMMRIYRDVRFAKDKSPYNTHVAFRFHAEGGALGYYVSIEADSTMLGSGVWQPDKEPLLAIRNAIAADCKGWNAAFSVKGWEPGGESLARPPQGFDKEHPCVEHLRRKDFVLFRKLPPSAITKADFADVVAADFADTKPLLKFLAGALGEKF